MLFNSYVFLFVFLPAAWAGYGLAARFGRVAAVLWLVLASLFFYSWWDAARGVGGPFLGARYLLVLGGSVVFNFIWGRWLSRVGEGVPGGRWILGIGIAANLAVLAWFKYAGFVATAVNELADAHWPVLRIALPIGISFFTFVQIAYLVDAWKGRAGRYSFLNYTLFATFFPHLMAGPIVHHNELLPQFERGPDRPMSENAAVGLTMLVIGLFKKVMIADNVAPMADFIFTAAVTGDPLTVARAWAGALCYTFQLYFDFSGYSDMAIGLALLFGVRFPQNFNSPYKALDVIDFWRRWHITLSRFLRDYLYIPLGGGRRGAARRYVNLVLTMLLGGLWHGAAWTFVVWGGLHGLYLVINHGWRALTAGRHPAGPEDGLGRTIWNFGVARPLTFITVVVGWVFFRADGFAAAGRILGAMAGVGTAEPTTPFDTQTALVWCAGLLAACWVLPNAQQLLEAYRPALDSHVRTEEAAGEWWPAWARWRPKAAWAFVMGGAALLVVPNLERVAAFLYWQF